MASVPDNQRVDYVPATRFNPTFAAKADALLPRLFERVVRPVNLVRFEPDEGAFFRLRRVEQTSIEGLNSKNWKRDDDFILDFGEHCVGYFSFYLNAEGVNIDAPAKLRLSFGEVPLDVTEDLLPCRSWISTSWVPEETITVDWLPSTVELPRRYSFRYVRIRILDTSPKYTVSFSNVIVRAVSSADPNAHVQPFKHDNQLLEMIDRVSIKTLQNCMHTVFEDGPRRDRRAWIGDLRLQALTNYCTVRDFKLVRRCLYLFAAVVREDGSLPASIFEKPILTPASDYIVDYDILYGSIVLDYVRESKDVQTGLDLWDTVMGSTKTALRHIDEKFTFVGSRTSAWKFLDWDERLERDAGMHGLVICSLKAINALASLISKPPPFTSEVENMSKAAESFYDTEQGVFVSGPNRQVSWASQAWMALAEVMSPNICKVALLRTMKNDQAVQPLTPYLYHYVAEALCVVGAREECIELIQGYWGAMALAGADTFWECFDPANPRASPYGDCHNNSYCHAWSCTPSYLFRRFL